jgi:hypothetical protein
VLVVVRIRRNGRPAAEQTKELLEAQGARVVGVVVNGLEPDASYASDAYGYAYGQEYRLYAADGHGRRKANGRDGESSASPQRQRG